MGLVRIDHHPPRWQLAVFGGTWLAVFGTLGFILRWQGVSPAAGWALWLAAVAVPAIGCVVPGFMRIVYVGMAYLALPIAWVVSCLMLAAVFYLVLTPTGLLMRTLGYDPMNRRFDKQAGSYWIPREGSREVGRYFRQF